MAAHRETEIKLRVRKPAQMKRLIESLGFRRITPRLREENTLFDFPGGKLMRERGALRLRTVGGKSLLTFKRTPRASGKYKVREEIETLVADPEPLRRIFQRLGLREVFAYQKHRVTYAPPGRASNAKRACLLYDETPAGNFLELEGPARWIDETARRLGYDSEAYITESYPSLYLRERKRRQ